MQQQRRIKMINTNELTNKERRRVNKQFRDKDDSHLWPVNGKFSVAERAISRARRLEKQGLVFDCVYSYEEFLNQEASKIVNGEV